VATESVGLSPEGIRLSPDAKYLAVALQNGTTRPPGSPFLHGEGRLVMFAVADGPKLIQMAEAPIGRWSQGIAFSRDGKTVLVQNMVERRIDVFRFEDDALTPSAPITLPHAGPAAIATPW
jgi:DNA-binding beta-propeller fold protein YncE